MVEEVQDDWVDEEEGVEVGQVEEEDKTDKEVQEEEVGGARGGQ